MKHVLIGAALALTASAAMAASPAGGFEGPDSLQLTTASAATKLADDTPVKLQGYIIKSIGDERYEFKDSSGTITVEIDNDDWGGVQATPETKVEIRGEIEKEWNGTEVDVHSVKLVP